ncbi:pyridoxamine 5'-phosphate oxidase family protein [Actinoplanes couchii]|uniref:Pyridoxamine 5'-phosphate oxidase n=1 Tax=Actinoplanes couchii TaxID=403638 RepID=A0ABQ3X2T6_9ACTN|nr:pyridoxamine 5'-phosphate oxidase family protein [Actinoplanes couchii]MDR6322589.1 hypothetical protein [Actinoplanes couchii]GID52822.1 hypothetical protein Aco03nite_012260 [Actinoplanes couchii]
MIEEPRSAVQRKADTLALLSSPVLDGWVATDGPNLVPLTLAWFRERLIAATDGANPTAKTLIATGRARIGLGHTRDVVLVDAELERWLPVTEAPEINDAYTTQNDWDPGKAGPSYVFLVLRPTRIQAWREADEIPARTLMRDGAWLI